MLARRMSVFLLFALALKSLVFYALHPRHLLHPLARTHPLDFLTRMYPTGYGVRYVLKAPKVTRANQWNTCPLRRYAGPSCSSTHVPGYIHHPKLQEAGQVFVVAVNDPFV